MSSTRQDSSEEVVPDTAPIEKETQKKHLNGGSTDIGPASPPKRQKKCASTVAEDTTHVMRLFLLTRSKSLTEQDIAVPTMKKRASLARNESSDDLETDAGPDSQDEAENQEEKIMEIAQRLGKIGDDFNEKYRKKHGDVDSLFATVFLATAYGAFKNGVEEVCLTVCGGNDPDVDSLAFVFYLTRRFVETAKDAGRHVEQSAEFGEQYVRERFGDWIEQRGGWVNVLDHDEPGTAID